MLGSQLPALEWDSGLMHYPSLERCTGHTGRYTGDGGNRVEVLLTRKRWVVFVLQESSMPGGYGTSIMMVSR